jgi:misacylated tRNA(Ala) deacylase
VTRLLFRDDAYRTEAEATVLAHTPEGAVILDAALFYPTGGGQPGDSGWLRWAEGRLPVAVAVKAAEGQVALVPAAPSTLPAIGATVLQEIDWTRRYRHMRMHTALHLLSVVLPFPVTGGQIGAERSRLDFDMADPPERVAEVEDALNGLIERDLMVTEDWISEDELAANPGLVKTMSVAPPSGQGPVRLIRIGQGRGLVDLQPCGGTHVARTAEIGRVAITKVEKKGRQNRRVVIDLAD